eukprot:m.99023 g.99023  ORF g.99023 m.99023 type:complete len:454 (+) comp12448_c0_seq1:94-1455(+)
MLRSSLRRFWTRQSPRWRLVLVATGVWVTILFILTLFSQSRVPIGTADPPLEVSATPLPGITCFRNPPNREGVLCQIQTPIKDGLSTEERSSGVPKYWQFLSEDEVSDPERAEAATRKLAVLDQFGSECFFTEAFPPVVAKSTSPFHVCTRIILDQHQGLALYWPYDNSAAMLDASILPPLMKLVLPDGSPGVAVDVGASTAMVSFPVIAAGHTVHLFDFALDNVNSEARALIQTTLDVNPGWRQRTHFHGYANASGPGSLSAILAGVRQLHLLKVDVDSIEADQAVFSGAEELLPRTEMLQVEMIEIGIDGKRHRISELARQGFDCYVYRGFYQMSDGSLAEEPGFCDISGPVDEVIGSPDQRSVFEWLQRWWLKGSQMTGSEVSELRGESVPPLRFNALDRVRLDPVCGRCEPGWVLGCNEHLVLKTCRQFVFVRRGTPTSSRVQKLYGNC